MAEEVLQSLFTLDKDDGYALRLEVWPQNEANSEKYGWVADFVIQGDDLEEPNLHRTVRRLKSFLDGYKRTSVS